MTEPLHFGDVRLPLDFWERVQPEYNSGCWLWTRGVSSKGYGHYRGTSAHRTALNAVLKEPLGQLLACHHCDNPPCVNPNHMFAGTVRDNNLDKIAKGRDRSLPAQNKAKTHCDKGHELVMGNLRKSVWLKRGWRLCNVCHKVDSKIRGDAKRRAILAAQSTPSPAR